MSSPGKDIVVEYIFAIPYLFCSQDLLFVADEVWDSEIGFWDYLKIGSTDE